MLAKALISCLLLGVLFLSCGNRSSATAKKGVVNEEKSISTNTEALLVGDWVEPNPIDEGNVQGIKLLEDGKAKSINMATLIYSKWWINDGQLVLVAQSLGNRVVGTDSMAFDIVKIDRDSLILRKKNFIVRYKRR